MPLILLSDRLLVQFIGLQSHLLSNYQKLIYCVLCYISQSPIRLRNLSFVKRKELHTSMMKRKQQDHFCCLVVEYAPLIKNYRDYELMCVNGKLSLKVLQEYILVKLNKQAVRSGLLFEVKGKIKPLGDSIGQLSAKCSEQDGFLYIFVRSQNTF